MYFGPMLGLIVAALGLGTALLAAAPAPAEENITPTRTVWDGVYTPEQAARGRDAYDIHCASCHREDLTGRSARALVGSRFWSDWGDFNLRVLLSRTAGTMPRNAPGSLDDPLYADIVAYVLERNDFPSGTDVLTPASAANVRVISRDGKPQPITEFSLVTMAGCLSGGGGSAWSLMSASHPLKTREPYPLKTEVLTDADAPPLAGQFVELDDVYPDPSAYIGNKMEARGFLVRGSAGQRVIKVTSLRKIDSACR